MLFYEPFKKFAVEILVSFWLQTALHWLAVLLCTRMDDQMTSHSWLNNGASQPLPELSSSWSDPPTEELEETDFEE